MEFITVDIYIDSNE